MTEPGAGFVTLNAFVDGELAPEEAAASARAAAADPALAGRIALLRTLQAAVVAIGEEIPPERLDIASLQARARQERRRRWPAALAGHRWLIILVPTLVVGMMMVAPPAGEPPVPHLVETRAASPYDSDMLQMITSHDRWASTGHADGQPLAHVTTAEARAAARLAPVLAAARLRAVHRRQMILASGRRAVERDYAGAGGCRLSLFAGGDGAPAEAIRLTTETAGGLRLASWTAGARYFLFVRGMDGLRFAALAEGFAAALGPAPGRAGAGREQAALLARLFADPPHCGR